MIPESKLKSDCTPEIIKRMVELAEGFEYSLDHVIYIIYTGGIIPCKHDVLKNPENTLIFSTLIHRAVEGWNKKYRDDNTFIFIGDNYVHHEYKAPRTKDDLYNFKNYQLQSLTPRECACLHCLIEVLKEERK